MGSFHPESPQRFDTIYSMLDQEDMLNRLKIIRPREASKEEITSIHTPDYYQMVANTAHQDQIVSLDPDTSACPDSFQAAKLAAGGLLSLVEAIQDNSISNGFALVRPPGHHAEANQARGFCIFNNIAVAAKQLIIQHGLNRVLIVDWDLHHGNGTHYSFYDNPQVLYFSTHQSPFYPGTGDFEEIGADKGKGYTVNLPLYPGAGDYEYIKTFREILLPIAREFRPEFILVSAGFDIHFNDLLGSMRVTPEGFVALTRLLLETANEVCNGKLALVLEGGYSLEALRDSVKAVLLELSSDSPVYSAPAEQEFQKNPYDIDSVIARVKEIHKDFWQCF